MNMPLPIPAGRARRRSSSVWAYGLLALAPLAILRGLPELALPGRTALAVAWSALGWPDTPVALAAALAW